MLWKPPFSFQKKHFISAQGALTPGFGAGGLWRSGCGWAARCCLCRAGPRDTSGQQTTCVRQRSPVLWEPTAPEGGVLSAFLYRWLLNFSTGGRCIFFPRHWVADGSDNWRHFQSRFKVKLIYTGGKNKPIKAVKHVAALDCDCSGISLAVLHLEKFGSWFLFCLLLSKFFSCNIPINWIIWESLVGFE